MPLLKLIRISGLFWSAADVLAGYGFMRFVAGHDGGWSRLPYVVAAGVLLVAAARVWEDVLSARSDRDRRPYRPIPAREITPTGALLWAAFLALAGLLCAMVGGYACFYYAGLILLVGMAWALGGGRVEMVGPLLAGAGRAGLWLLGMGLHPALAHFDATVHTPPALVAAYAAMAAALPSLRSAALAVAASRKTAPGPNDRTPEEPPAENPVPDAAAARPMDEGSSEGLGPGERDRRTERVRRYWRRAGGSGGGATDRRALTAGCVALALMPVATAWLLPRGWPWVFLAGWWVLLLALSARALWAPGAGTFRSLAGGAWLSGIWLNAALLAGYAGYGPVALTERWTVSLPRAGEAAWILGVWLLFWPAWRYAREETDGVTQKPVE